MPADYPSQNAGHPTNEVAGKWRRSCLASPQTAGLPTDFNEDGMGTMDFDEPTGIVDLTGGVMDYRRKQRKVSE